MAGFQSALQCERSFDLEIFALSLHRLYDPHVSTGSGGKILSPPMNSLMALMQNYFECRRLMGVPPGLLRLLPRCIPRWVVFRRLQRPNVPLEEFGRYEHFLRRLFNHRRKQLQKILRSLFLPERVAEILERGGIEGVMRTESLSLAQVLFLYRQWEGGGDAPPVAIPR